MMGERPRIQIYDETAIPRGRPPRQDNPLQIEHTPPIRRGRPARRALFTWEKRLTEDGARAIKHYAAQFPDMPFIEIARHFGFTRYMVEHVMAGRAWKDIE